MILSFAYSEGSVADRSSAMSSCSTLERANSRDSTPYRPMRASLCTTAITTMGAPQRNSTPAQTLSMRRIILSLMPSPPLPAVAVVAVVCVMTASFNEGECMGASVDVATWVSVGCAAVSAVFAGVTVWWPWHTRPAPDLRHEKDEFSVTRESMAHLLVTCGLQRPRLLVRWRNDGDGTAYAVTVKAADGSCAVRMAVPDTSKPSGFDFVDSVGKMEPGESFEAIILPTSTEDVDKPVVLLDWKESPTRLRMGHGSERVALPYRLPGKRPLLRQERILALHMIQTTAAEYGYPYEQFASQMLGIDLEDLDPWSAPDSKSKTESPDSGE